MSSKKIAILSLAGTIMIILILSTTIGPLLYQGLLSISPEIFAIKNTGPITDSWHGGVYEMSNDDESSTFFIRGQGKVQDIISWHKSGNLLFMIGHPNPLSVDFDYHGPKISDIPLSFFIFNLDTGYMRKYDSISKIKNNEVKQAFVQMEKQHSESNSN